MERCVPILVLLKIDVTASSNEMFRNGLIGISGRKVDRGAPILLLVIDVTTSRVTEPAAGYREPLWS